MDFKNIKALGMQVPLTLVINGDCMTGVLHDGCRVVTEYRRLYCPGDIIIYARGDDVLVSHRFLGYVLRRRGWLALTRADQSLITDAPCPVARVLGKIIRVDDKEVRVTTRQRILSFTHYWLAVAGWLEDRFQWVPGEGTS
jgi:hypothetical protein